MQRFIPFLPIAATFGVILALRETSPIFIAILLLFLFFCHLQRHYFRSLPLFGLLTIFIYYFCALYHLELQQSGYEEGVATVEGIIHSIPVVDGDLFSMDFKSELGEVIRVRSFIRNEEEQKRLQAFAPGDRCRITGTFEAPSPPTNFDQFDYRRYLREQGIFWLLRPKTENMDCKSSYHRAYALERWRHQQMIHLEKTVSPDLVGIMSALLFGERIMIDEEVLDAYERLGLIHLLAVSGLHVGLVVTSIFYVLIRIGITRERVYEILILALPFYAVIAGAAPSVIRASIMTFIVLLFLRLKVKLPPLYGIIAVYMVYLLLNPFILFHLGFQLSFLISFALIVSAHTIQKLNLYVSQLFAITILSQLFAFPLLLYYTFELAWISIPLNMLYIPFVTFFVLPFSFISFGLTFLLPNRFNLPLLLLEWSVPYTHRWLTVISSQKWATLITGKPHLLIVICLYAVIGYGVFLFEQGGRRWWRKPVSLLFIVLIIQLSLPFFNPCAKVTMLDVGQGDSFLIELPFRKEIYLIDTGGAMSFNNEPWRKRRRTFDVGEKIVVPALKSQGIRTIDRLILTHGHFDHIGGAAAVVHSFWVKEVLYGVGAMDGEYERQLQKVFLRKGGTWKFVQEGMHWQSGSSTFFILAPTGNENELNARSVVLFAEIEGITFLFTGDLEEEGEKRLIISYPHLRADVLKVGHHGSMTSTGERFLNHLSPRAALISVGRNNHFGHPHNDVLKRLYERKMTIWRSDEGAVRLILRTGNVKVEQMIKHE